MTAPRKLLLISHACHALLFFGFVGGLLPIEFVVFIVLSELVFMKEDKQVISDRISKSHEFSMWLADFVKEQVKRK